MSDEKTVTSEGVPQDLDLGHVEPPNEDNLNSLDTAMRAAGILDPGEEPEPTAIEPAPVAEPDQLSGEEKSEPEEDLSSVDLDSIEPPQDISPRNLVNFDKLREVARHFKTESAQVPELLKQLEEFRSASAAIPKEVLDELAELRTMRRIFDTENDPEFKKEFDGKLNSIDDDVLSILRKNGLPEETEKNLRQLGLDKVAPKWWEESVLSKVSFVDQERIRKRLAERADISENRAKLIEQFQSSRESFIQHAETQKQAQQEQMEEQIFEHVNALTENVPWARYQEIAPNASEADKKSIEAHNAAVQELETRFRQALYPETPQSRAEVAAAAVASVKLSESVSDLSARLRDSNARAEKAEKALEAVRAAGKAPSARQGGRKASADAPDMAKLSDEDAIEVGLMAAESAMA